MSASTKCVRDLRDAPLEEFRLPNDGRSWKFVARNRQALANYLATFADGDGSRVYPGEKTITNHFGWHRATTFRMLKDLEELRLQKKVGRQGGSHGTALRLLDVTAFRGRLGVASSSSESQVPNVSESQLRNVGVASSSSESQVGLSESHVGATQPSVEPPPQPPPTATEKSGGGGRSLEKKYMATIGKWGPRNLEQLEVLVAEHGVDTVDRAVAAAIADGGLEDVKSKSGCVLFRLPEKIAKHKADADAAIRKAKREAAIQRDIEFQTVQLLFSHHERWFDHRFLTTDADKSLFSKIKSDTRTFEPEDARDLYERFQEWLKAQPKNDFEF